MYLPKKKKSAEFSSAHTLGKCQHGNIKSILTQEQKGGYKHVGVISLGNNFLYISRDIKCL